MLVPEALNVMSKNSRLSKSQARLIAAQDFLKANGIDPGTRLDLPVSSKITPRAGGSPRQRQRPSEAGIKRASKDSYSRRLAKLKLMMAATTDEERRNDLSAYLAQLTEAIQGGKMTDKEVYAEMMQKYVLQLVDNPELEAMSFECDAESHINKVTYKPMDGNTGELIVEFDKNGSIVLYEDVPPSVYAQLEATRKAGGHVGVTFWRVVRGRFGFMYTLHGSNYQFHYTSGGPTSSMELEVSQPTFSKKGKPMSIEQAIKYAELGAFGENWNPEKMRKMFDDARTDRYNAMRDIAKAKPGTPEYKKAKGRMGELREEANKWRGLRTPYKVNKYNTERGNTTFGELLQKEHGEATTKRREAYRKHNNERRCRTLISGGMYDGEG